MCDRRVEGNAIQPCVKCAGALERLQLEECLNEGLLDYVLGILGVADHVDHGVVQPILVLLHQLPEGCRLSSQGLSNQLGVVVHSCLTVRDAGRNQEVPATSIIPGQRPMSNRFLRI